MRKTEKISLKSLTKHFQDKNIELGYFWSDTGFPVYNIWVNIDLFGVCIGL